MPISFFFFLENELWLVRLNWASIVAQMVKNPPATQETHVQPLDWEDPPKKGMATHSILTRLNNFAQATLFFSTTLQSQPIGWKLPFGSSCFLLLIFLLLGEQFFLFCFKIWGDLLCFRGTKVSISVPESHVWSISCLPRMRCGGPCSLTTGSA